MMGNIIEGGVIGAAQAPYPITAKHLSAAPVSLQTTISTGETSEAIADSSVEHVESLESTESSKARVQPKSARSKSLESLTIPSDRGQSSTLKHQVASKKFNSMSSEILSKPEEFQLTIRDFLNKFKLSMPLGGKQSCDRSAEPPKEDKTIENELQKPEDVSSTERQKCPDSASASLASVESYRMASESTEESGLEDTKGKNLSRNSSVFSLQPDVDNEIARISSNIAPENTDVASEFEPKPDRLPTDDPKIVRTRSGRQLLGRAFSCDGSGIRCVGGNYPSPNEDSDTSESDRDQSNPLTELAESIDELHIAESDEEDRTLVVDEGVTKGAREESDDDKSCEGDTFPDDCIKVKDQDRIGLAWISSSSSGNKACLNPADQTGLATEKALGQYVKNITESQYPQEIQDEGKVTDKPFEVDAMNVDPSSAASEQVLENLISSSSSQPSFDDPDLTETSVFVFPDGKSGSDQAERICEILDEADLEEDSIEKLPKSPLVRSGSRIIDKKTKTIRGRPKSCHSSSFQTGIKEEIFTEMGFAQDQHDSGKEEQSDLAVTPKPRVPFKSMQVQSLVEMPEEEGEATLEKNRTYTSKAASCRPKSFPSAGFFEGTDSVDLNLNPEAVKKIPDILNKSYESGYVSSSYSQSPPLRSLTATPSLTMPSGLTQPKLLSSQNFQSTEVDHFVITCRNESTRKIDEHANLEKFKAVLRREPQGYGMRTGGNKPVLILSVVEGSVAARHGLKARDVIFMLNGTNVSQYDHESVLSFFKASRSHLEIVVLRQVDHKGDAQKSIGNQIEYLKTHPALMACLLLDLTLQNKQNSLFFSMAVYLLRQKDAGDSNFQRWAYEIFSTFLDQHAPLKLQHGLEVPSISGLLSSDEESIRRSYDSVDQFLQPIIKKQLNDYLKNKGLVHEFELTNMDHLKQIKYIEKVLWKSFETLSSEEKDDKKQALAASMATFFHLVGFSSIRGGNLLESFPSFVSNKLPSKLKKSKGHLFRTEYITNMSPCGVCKQPTWNLGTTVYKCSSCSFHIHSYCLFKLTEACNFKRKTSSFAPFYVVEDPNCSFDLSKSYAGLFRSRSCQLSCKSAFIGDPDLDIPLDLPHLKDVIPHEDLKKLKNKELKFQEIVNELFHTEKLHLRSLKIMKMLYERPMRAEPSISNITNLLFPNLDELIRVHDQLNVEFEKCKEEQTVVTRIGGLLVSLLSGLRGDQLKRASAIFCKDQSYSLFALRKNLRKEKLSQIIQEAALNPYSGRLSLKDFLPKEMQRITKYPLLIDSLVHNSPANSEEHAKLVEASKLSRNILRYVDTQVRDCENGRKLMDLQLRLDARQLENSTDPNVIPYRKLNLTRKKLIMDGELSWKYKRAGGSKTQNLHVVLCEDILLLLVKQEERLVLKCHTTTIEDHIYVYYPVLQLSGLLAKDAGRDKCAFFIVDRNSPQVYHLAAKNKELRNRWFNTLTETVNNLARSAPSVAVSTALPKILPKSVFPSSASANQLHDKSSERSLVENDRHSGNGTFEFKSGEMTSQPCLRRESAPSLVGSSKRKLPSAPSRSFDVGSTVEDERRISRPLHLPLSLLQSPSLPSPPLPACDDDDDDDNASLFDDLKRNILMVNSLLQQKISVSCLDGDCRSLRPHLLSSCHPPLQRHRMWDPLSKSSSSSLDNRSIGGGRDMLSCPSSLSSTSSSSSSWTGVDNYAHMVNDNVRLLSDLPRMTEKEVVSYCLPQVAAIRSLINDPHLCAVDADVAYDNDPRHLQQLRHWKLQSLRLKGQNDRSKESLSIGSCNINSNNSNNNSYGSINSTPSPVENRSNILLSPQSVVDDVFAVSLRHNSVTLSKVVSLTTKIELALGQLAMNKFKRETEVAECSVPPISS